MFRESRLLVELAIDGGVLPNATASLDPGRAKWALIALLYWQHVDCDIR